MAEGAGAKLAAGSGRPLWQQVLDDLERRLAEGEFTDRFPTDRELVETYGTSRHTVREAVRHLKARGIIARERGRGSQVTPTGLTQPMGALYNLFSAVEEAGHAQQSRVLARGLRVDATAAEQFGFDPTTPLVHIERVRLLDGEPMALDTVWLAPDVGQPLLDAELARTSLYDEMAERAGVRPDAGRERVTAIMPTPEMREVLALDDDEALLRIDRVTSQAGRVIECRLTLLRSSRMAVVTQWPGESISGLVVGAGEDGDAPDE